MLIYEPKEYPSLNWKIGDTVINHDTKKIVGKVYIINHPYVYFRVSPYGDDDVCFITGYSGHYSSMSYTPRESPKYLLKYSRIIYPRYSQL
jgi:hypothetical protein